MAQAKKFGTFAGVFTPSILTILGVIMYLRLGYIVGEAGFYAIMGLIIIAHVISISTGLSLSSIATDKLQTQINLRRMSKTNEGFRSIKMNDEFAPEDVIAFS